MKTRNSRKGLGSLTVTKQPIKKLHYEKLFGSPFRGTIKAINTIFSYQLLLLRKSVKQNGG